MYAHEECYKAWREESVSHRRTTSRPAHVIAGQIAKIGDGYVLRGFSSALIQLTDELADGFHPG